MKKKTRTTSKPDILDSAVHFARLRGLRKFSRSEVAKRANVAEATVSYHFKGMEQLRQDVVTHAIKNEVLEILADARTDRDSANLYTRMPTALKEKVAAFITR